MIIFRILSNVFNAYVHMVNRFMGEEKHVWTPKDLFLLMGIFVFMLFSIVLLFSFFKVI
ncbi:MAG: hypothetical protein ACJ75J_00650 [Cytophagaceae bacterium]